MNEAKHASVDLCLSDFAKVKQMLSEYLADYSASLPVSVHSTD
jgi:hypothetical protein